MLLLEEGTVEGLSDRVIEELEAVEDLDGTAALDADDAAEYTGGDSVASVGGVLGLDLDAGVMIGYVDDDQRVELEVKAAFRRRRRHRRPFTCLPPPLPERGDCF